MQHDFRRFPFRRQTGVRDGEAGFTLVEVAVSILLAVILMVGLTQSLVAAMTAQRETRLQEQATVLGIEGIEYARSVPWVELSVDPAVDPADPLIITSGSDHLLDGSYVDLPTDEVVIEAAGGLVPPSQLENLDGKEFLVKNYVTDSGAAGLRRITVVVEFEINSSLRRHHTSTLISEVTAP